MDLSCCIALHKLQLSWSSVEPVALPTALTCAELPVAQTSRDDTRTRHAIGVAGRDFAFRNRRSIPQCLRSRGSTRAAEFVHGDDHRPDRRRALRHGRAMPHHRGRRQCLRRTGGLPRVVDATQRRQRFASGRGKSCRQPTQGDRAQRRGVNLPDVAGSGRLLCRRRNCGLCPCQRTRSCLPLAHGPAGRCRRHQVALRADVSGSGASVCSARGSRRKRS